MAAALQPRLDPVPQSLAWWAMGSHPTVGVLQSGAGLDFWVWCWLEELFAAPSKLLPVKSRFLPFPT